MNVNKIIVNKILTTKDSNVIIIKNSLNSPRVFYADDYNINIFVNNILNVEEMCKQYNLRKINQNFNSTDILYMFKQKTKEEGCTYIHIIYKSKEEDSLTKDELVASLQEYFNGFLGIK